MSSASTVKLAHGKENELDRARRRIAELEEQVAAWKTFHARKTKDDLDRDRLAKIKGALRLRTQECRLLMHFLDHPGRTLGKGSLCDALDTNAETDSRLVDVLICRIKARLKEAGIDDPFLPTRGVGVALDVNALPKIKALWGEHG